MSSSSTRGGGSGDATESSSATETLVDINQRLSRILKNGGRVGKKERLEVVIKMLEGVVDISSPSSKSSSKSLSKALSGVSPKILVVNSSLCRLALNKACLDRTVPYHAMTLVLNHMRQIGTVASALKLTMEDRTRLLVSSVQCHNPVAIQCLIDDDKGSILSSSGSSNTILHRVCERNRWNDGIALLLDAILRRRHRNTKRECINNRNNSEMHASDEEKEEGEINDEQYALGMFEWDPATHTTPLSMCVENGDNSSDDLVTILRYLRDYHSVYFNIHLNRYAYYIAQYCDAMTFLEEVVNVYPSILIIPAIRDHDEDNNDHNNNSDNKNNKQHYRTSNDGDTPLHFACYYQNQEMIRFLLGTLSDDDGNRNIRTTCRGHRRRHRRRNTANGRGYCFPPTRTAHQQQHHQSQLQRKDALLNHLLKPNHRNISPLGHLILSLGKLDSVNSIECVQICTDSIGGHDNLLPLLLHHAIDKYWEDLSNKLVLHTTIMRIIQLYDVLPPHQERVEQHTTFVSYMNRHGMGIMSLVIPKLAKMEMNKKKNGRVLSVVRESMTIFGFFLKIFATTDDDDMASRRDDITGRLLLHVACENGLQFYHTYYNEHPSVLNTILQRNVHALEVVDPVSGLLPFALSAAVTKTAATSSSINNNDPSNKVNTIYELLRYNPGVLSLFSDR